MERDIIYYTSKFLYTIEEQLSIEENPYIQRDYLFSELNTVSGEYKELTYVLYKPSDNTAIFLYTNTQFNDTFVLRFHVSTSEFYAFHFKGLVNIPQRMDNSRTYKFHYKGCNFLFLANEKQFNQILKTFPTRHVDIYKCKYIYNNPDTKNVTDLKLKLHETENKSWFQYSIWDLFNMNENKYLDLDNREFKNKCTHPFIVFLYLDRIYYIIKDNGIDFASTILDNFSFNKKNETGTTKKLSEKQTKLLWEPITEVETEELPEKKGITIKF